MRSSPSSYAYARAGDRDATLKSRFEGVDESSRHPGGRGASPTTTMTTSPTMTMTTSKAIDVAIERARTRARDAERALAAKMSRSMRDLTNARGREGGKSGVGSSGTVKTTTRVESNSNGAKESEHSWMDDVVRRARSEAERAERMGGMTMRARAASTVDAVLRGAAREGDVVHQSGAVRTPVRGDMAQVETEEDWDMDEASPASVRSESAASPRYRAADVEAIKETLRTDYENSLTLMRERAEAAEKEVEVLTVKLSELEQGRRSARNALAEMASQNAKLVSAFSAKKDEVRTLKATMESTSTSTSTVETELKNQNEVLREELASAKSELRATSEKSVLRKDELAAAQSEIAMLRAQLKSNDGVRQLETKLDMLTKELELEREMFASQKASWKQERTKLMRLATDTSPKKSTPRSTPSEENGNEEEPANIKSHAPVTPPKQQPTGHKGTPKRVKSSPGDVILPNRSRSKSRRCVLREQAEELKVRGNQQFHAKSYDDALQAYSDALAVEFDDEAFRAVLHANKAAALQANGKFCEAVMECCISRTYDSTYIRALQRRADAYLSMGDWPMAMKDLEELTPYMGEDCAAKLREAQRKVKNGATSCEHYAVLGVSSRATQSEVSKAYKSLALKFHPDKAPSNEVRPASEALFKRVAEAYAILKDASKRASYDAALVSARLRRAYTL